MTNAAEDFSSWIGRAEAVVDDLSPATAQAASAIFEEEFTEFRAGVELPLLWHWFYFLAKTPQSKLDEDGHSQREANSFIPPIPLPRRMFAGARLRWFRPLICGQPARRQAVIRDVARKSGRSGSLAFVTVDYRIDQAGLVCLEEQQDIVYRQPGAPLPAPAPSEWPELPRGAWSRTITPDTRLLFRFSALTFNAHRIHYDRSYATAKEGYPGLVVHGPLTAMLLLQMVRQHTPRAIAAFDFRGQAPLFDLAPFRLVGRPAPEQVELEAQGPDGKTAMTAMARYSPTAAS